MRRYGRFLDGSRKKIGGISCVYCGEPPTVWDHFPPASVSITGFKLPSCHQCNSALRADFAYDFVDRCNFIKMWLFRRYRKVIRTPDWHESEIKDMSEQMQKRIRIMVLEKERAKRRIDWDALSYLSTLECGEDVLQPIITGWHEKVGAAESANPF